MPSNFFLLLIIYAHPCDPFTFPEFEFYNRITVDLLMKFIIRHSFYVASLPRTHDVCALCFLSTQFVLLTLLLSLYIPLFDFDRELKVKTRLFFRSIFFCCDLKKKLAKTGDKLTECLKNIRKPVSFGSISVDMHVLQIWIKKKVLWLLS